MKISESPCLILGSVGIVMVNVEPFPTELSAETVPPCASTMRLQIVSPRPIPLALVVKKGDQNFVMTSLGIPTPVSEKLTVTPSFAFVLFTVSVPPLGIASNAFSTILAKAVFIWGGHSSPSAEPRRHRETKKRNGRTRSCNDPLSGN